MKRLLLIVSCALLCPMHLLDAAEETASTQRTARRATGKKPAAKKTTKSTAVKSKAAQPKAERTKTTTAGKKTTTAKKTAAPKAKTTTSRAKTTTAGKKAHATKKSAQPAKKPTHTTKKPTKPAKDARAKKSTYSTKQTDKSASAAQTKAKRVYRKGGVEYKHFKHLNDATAQKLGTINKPITRTISLNEPGRGYKNANHITFTTPDGQLGHIVLDSHVLDAARAEKKGLHKLAHVGQKTVEVFAGTDAKGKGLALIDEYPLLNANLKGTQDLQISVEPNGHVTLSGKNDAGNFAPITEFSIHQ